MNALINALSRSKLMSQDLDLHLVRASMVIIFFFFGYQKWWEYEAQILISWGALGSVITYVMTVTIIPFMPDGWAESAGGFPAMVGNVPFLMKDVVLLAASVYLLKQDVAKVAA